MRQRYLRAPTVQNYSILVRDVPQEVDCRTVKTGVLGVGRVHSVVG